MVLSKRCALAFPLLFTAALAIAQPSISLKDLLRQVDQHSPSLLVDSAGVLIKQRQYQATLYNWLPSFKLNYQADVGTNNNMPGGYFSYGIVPGNSRVRTEGNSSTVLTDLGIAAFSWEVFNFGAYGAQRRLANSELATEQAKYTLSQYQLEGNAVELYFQVCRLQELKRLHSQNIERSESVLRSVVALARNGIRPGVDTSIANAELSRGRLDMLEVERLLLQTKIRIANLSGISVSELFADTSYIQRVIDHSLSLQAQAGKTQGLFTQPYELELQSNKDRERLLRKSYNPRVSFDAAAWGRGSSISAADDFRPLASGLGVERANYLVGLGITYDIFDLKRRAIKLDIQKAATDRSQRELEEQQSILNQSLLDADADLRIAERRQREIPLQLAAATAAYRQKLSLFRNGLTDIFELDAAQNLVFRAEIDDVNSRYQYCLAILRKAIWNNSFWELINSL